MSVWAEESVSTPAAAPDGVSAAGVSATQRIEELGRIIMAYSEVTEKLQQSHERLESTVQMLRDELSEKSRLLERKNRLAALGEMAAGMAHEIRNPLGGIQLFASILAKDVADRPESLKVVRRISDGVKRLESLVSQVLQFTREIQVHAVPMDLDAVVHQAIELISPQLDQRAICCAIDGSSLNVVADPTLIGQVVLNLVLNAAEAMDRAGHIRIRYTAPPPGSDAKQFHLAVRDTGPGIPAGVMDRIFNPFFTTKETGTGLGLAIVHRVVEAHEGTVTAINEPDGGARFEIRI
jgi:signal transduction histidine kinase